MLKPVTSYLQYSNSTLVVCSLYSIDQLHTPKTSPLPRRIESPDTTEHSADWNLICQSKNALRHPYEGRQLGGCNLISSRLPWWNPADRCANRPKTLIWAFNIDRREFNLLSEWKKNSRCPKIHLSVTKWTLIFSIWRKALNRSAINSGSKTWKIPNVIRNVILRFKSCFLRAWISIWFYSLLLELAEWYDKSIGTHTVTFLLQNFELDFRCAFNHTRSFCEST